ncbi:alpha-mannosidase [Moesziomyces antarcticus]|uniref:Alpha-mannosidase n=2 Tax=Pseudozyma antarctica TaxID=84753 RepID=A0A081CLH1_PSEA2|nr:alpha-mannosidase [Moesziomyces antarcticus]GAK67517.1 alpha-mannosidase [Moesziomyces antarcticus]SPO48782.1 probable AMS1 - alpha-mannosidase [Moesziomyces antarcticus]
MCGPTSHQAPYPLLSEQATRPVRPLPIRSIQEKRIHEFIGGQFASDNVSSLLYAGRTNATENVQIESWSPPNGMRPNFAEASAQTFRPCRIGDKFGPSWSNHWLKLTLSVPTEWADLDGVELEFDASCEALIFDQHGNPLQGFTGGQEFDRRHDFPLPKGDKARKGAVYYVEITGNGMFGIHGKDTRYYDLGIGSDPDPDRYFELAKVDLVLKRLEAWQLMYDFTTLQQCVEELPKDGVLQNKALFIANEIMNIFRRSDVSSIARCRQLAGEVFGEAWSSSASSLFAGDAEIASKDNKALVWSLGHCHIDCVWLWSFDAAQQKVARSWTTQLALMERYPEYRFTASSPQQFKWIETLYPSLFERIRQKVKEGRFQPIGGLWVECDANMPSGESFARQLLYGQRYLHSRFGTTSNVFFLPDSFGYNSQIPQLARQAGFDYFFTQKLCWNRTNTFPHCTMMWTGLDGTQIIFSQSSIPNYNSRCGINDMIKATRRNPDLGVQPSCLHLFGFGDGGGGANPEHIERLRRARALHDNGYTEVPKVTLGRSAKDFFEHVLETTRNGDRLATWSGEVYLEFHRGVYTSQAEMKRWNRLVELRLHDIEWLCTLAAVRDAGYSYPHERLLQVWEPFMLGQFHDCLPGSSIRKVYDDMKNTYARLTVEMDQLRAEASAVLHAQQPDRAASADAILLAPNTLAMPRQEVVELDAAAYDKLQSRPQVLQKLQNGNSLLLLRDIHACGVLKHTASSSQQEPVSARQEGDAFVLESADMRLCIQDGRISSIYDKAERREMVAFGQSAGLSISQDYPPEFDNWEVEMYSLDTVEQLAFETVEIEDVGPYRASLSATLAIGEASRAKVSIFMDAIPLIPQLANGEQARTAVQIRLSIDWHESHRFLRFEVPTTIRADMANFEMQFGHVARPTTRNTSWEAAKFEVCGHRFADLSEPNYGLAMLTQTKYGYSVEGGLMRLSLLKAGAYPDSQMDRGSHVVDFALYPHRGNLMDGDVVAVARAYNAKPVLPGLLREGSDPSAWACPVRVVQDSTARYSHVVLETVKMAEPRLDGGKEGKSIICRLYEAFGTRSSVTLECDLPVKRVSITDLLEQDHDGETCALNEAGALSSDGLLKAVLHLRAFQFMTVRIELA